MVGSSSEVCSALGREPSAGTEISHGARKCDSRPPRTPKRRSGESVGAGLSEWHECQPIDDEAHPGRRAQGQVGRGEQDEASVHEVATGSVLFTTQDAFNTSPTCLANS